MTASWADSEQSWAACAGARQLARGRHQRLTYVQKTHSSFYQAFDSLTFPYLANLGVDVDWNKEALLRVQGVYRPRFEVSASVLQCLPSKAQDVALNIRLPIVKLVSGI